jgi:hypothetical protein
MNFETTADFAALDYWGVSDVDQPIGLVPFPCGRYVSNLVNAVATDGAGSMPSWEYARPVRRVTD